MVVTGESSALYAEVAGVTDTAGSGDAGKPDPGETATAGEFVEALRRLKRWTGMGYRQLAKRAAAAGHALPRSTLTVALNRGTLPREDLVAAFVRTCGCDDAEVAAWVNARRRIAAAAGPNGAAPRWLGHRLLPAGERDRPDTGADPPEYAETLELINAELAERQTRQAAVAASIETRSILLVGFVAVAAQFLATRHGEPVLQRTAFAAYALSAGSGIAALAARSSSPEPAADTLVEDYADGPRERALARLAAARVTALRENSVRHQRRTRWWWLAVAALAVATVLSIAAIRQA
jgi:hypothetical protein